jgi:hypothetical protein
MQLSIYAALLDTEHPRERLIAELVHGWQLRTHRHLIIPPPLLVVPPKNTIGVVVVWLLEPIQPIEKQPPLTAVSSLGVNSRFSSVFGLGASVWAALAVMAFLLHPLQREIAGPSLTAHK